MTSPATGYQAVEAGTDLAVRARELQRTHDEVISGRRPRARPRAVVARSWRRTMAAGLEPDRQNGRDPLSAAVVEERRTASPLSLIVDELRAVLGSVGDASHFLVVVTDGDGVVLWRDGSSAVRRHADRLGFAEGATWTEETVGTNAIGTALAEAAPVQLFSAEHFEQQQHPWYCSAVPVHDPRTGDLLGIVDVSGPALTLHPAVGALVETSVRLAESRLWQRHRDQLEQLRRSTEAVVSGSRGPLLVVDDLGWVAHSSGVTSRDRVEVPHPDRPLAVPGLGLCVPERLSGGWLVRPPGEGSRLRARLEPGPHPVLVVSGEGGAWTHVLTRRHAEILRALAEAPPPGLGAAELSVLLHGDAEHQVTVRAEVSRLRRGIGGLVATSPYRLADGVALEIGQD